MLRDRLARPDGTQRRVPTIPKGEVIDRGLPRLVDEEYRLAMKLGTVRRWRKAMAAAFQRVCVDLRRVRAVGLDDWWNVRPPDRMWVWLTDLEQAATDLGLDFNT